MFKQQLTILKLSLKSLTSSSQNNLGQHMSQHRVSHSDVINSDLISDASHNPPKPNDAATIAKVYPVLNHSPQWRRSFVALGLSCGVWGTAALAPATVPNLFLSPVYGSLFNSALDRLPPAQRHALRQGEVVVTGQNGRYVARVLVSASQQQVWNLLTDYGNLPKFIPNLTSSKVISQRGSQKVVEQEDRRQIFLVSIVSKVRLAIKEAAPKKIDFKLISGDLQKMEGSWQIEPVIDHPRKPPTQMLITHTVLVQPRSNTPAESFYEIFKDSLSETMGAIQQEVKRRQ